MLNTTLTNPAVSSPTSTSTASGYSGGSSASSGTSSTGATSNSKLSLTPTDFVNMMITQLKNQDPTQPTSNADLLQEMSQIGQLQSQQSLQTNLQSMVLQNQIGSASNFIGKSVSGLGANSTNINGVVDSVHIENGGVNLVLDNGSTLPLGSLTDVDTGSGGTAATSTTSAGTTTPAASTTTNTTGASTSSNAGA
jgi:flagellar basal-body rod modification protein FlgD